MKILAIETSCDETGVALVEGVRDGASISFNILGAALLSQAPLHAEYGGVYPNLAKREHEKNLPVMLAECLTRAGMTMGGANPGIDAVAVTHGPGLEPALWTGVTFATQLAAAWQVPLLPMNHMEGHLLSSLVADGTLPDVERPVLALLISGGHTEFVLMRDWFSYEIIGRTLDDAVGEAFDKVARMLGLPYPGGPHISIYAAHARQAGQTSPTALPRPMLSANSCDVSFSGLKTAALYALRGKELNEEEKQAFAREFEDAAVDVFVAKTRRALEATDARTFVIGGGVAANTHIRESLRKLVADEFPDVVFKLPELSITGDNAIMIAQVALARRLSGLDDTARGEVRAIGNLSL